MLAIVGVIFFLSFSAHAMDSEDIYSFSTSDWGIEPVFPSSSGCGQRFDPNCVYVKLQADQENFFSGKIVLQEEYDNQRIKLHLSRADEGFLMQGIFAWMHEQKNNIATRGKKSELVEKLINVWLKQWLINKGYSVDEGLDNSIILEKAFDDLKAISQMQVLEYISHEKSDTLVLANRKLKNKADGVVTQLKHKHFMQTTMLCTTFFGMGFLLCGFMHYEFKKMQ